MRPTLIEQIEMEAYKKISHDASLAIIAMYQKNKCCTHSNDKMHTLIQCDNSIPTNKKQKWVCIQCNTIIEYAMEDGAKYIDTPLFK